MLKMETMLGELKGVSKRIELVENQVTQNASQIPRPQGQLHGHPDPNPKGGVAAVTLRSGNELEVFVPMSPSEVVELDIEH